MRLKHGFPCLRRKEPKEAQKERPASVNGDASSSEKQQHKEDFEVEIEVKSTEDEGSLWLQIVAALSASLALMSCGSHVGWTSPALPYLEGPTSELHVSPGQGSWIASLYTLGSIGGCLLSPPLLDRLGRKRSLLAFALPQLAGWLLLLLARSPWVLYAGRLVAGLGHGGVYNAAVVYLAEIADRRLRGAFGSLLKLATNLGGLYVAGLAAAGLSYRWLTLGCLLLPLGFLGSFCLVPESPYFYLLRGRDDLAEASLAQLRRLPHKGPNGLPGQIRRDLEAMRTALLSARGEAAGRGALRELVSRPGNRRGLWILLGLKATQQLSGHMAVVAYAQEIFERAGCSAPGNAVVALGLAQLAAGGAALALVDRLGRRPLILFSGCGAAVCLVSVGCCFWYLARGSGDSGTDREPVLLLLGWLSVGSLVLYEVMVALGIGSVPYVLLGEIFPTNVRGPAVASGILVGSLLAFLVSLGFRMLNGFAGIHGTFWFFALCCASGTLWVYVITPETKGKTLEEIQLLFNPGDVKEQNTRRETVL